MISRSEIDAYHRLTKLHEEAVKLADDLAYARADLAFRMRRNAADAVDLTMVLDLMMEDARTLIARGGATRPVPATVEFEGIVASLRTIARDATDSG